MLCKGARHRLADFLHQQSAAGSWGARLPASLCELRRTSACPGVVLDPVLTSEKRSGFAFGFAVTRRRDSAPHSARFEHGRREVGNSGSRAEQIYSLLSVQPELGRHLDGTAQRVGWTKVQSDRRAGATLPIASMHQCGTWHPCTIQQLCTRHHADNATMRYVAPMCRCLAPSGTFPAPFHFG
jgi:hypothetical protein